jgi:dolichol-phosphate mannosyltransferase
MTGEIDFIVPVYNEGSNISRALAELYATVTRPKQVLIVYDFDPSWVILLSALSFRSAVR